MKIPLLMFTGVASILAVVKFFQKSLTKDFIILNGIIATSSIIAAVVMAAYTQSGVGGMFSYLVDFAPVILASILLYLQSEAKTVEDKVLYLSGILVAILAIIVFTPLQSIVTGYIGTFTYVTTYINPTFQTIAEETAAPTDFSSTLGVLGANIPFSISIWILIISLLVLIISLYFSLSKKSVQGGFVILALIALIGIFPVALPGFLKAKYAPYLGIMVPHMFCISIGELRRMLEKNSWARKAILIFVAIILVSQAASYYDLILSSLNISFTIDVTNNDTFMPAICDNKSTEIQYTYTTLSNSPLSFMKDWIASSMYTSSHIYCTRIPDYWLDTMTWIRNNVGEEERVISWWDYGHWINTFGQSKSVTGNTHQYPIMHQEVADKIVSNTPEALAAYMQAHKRKYILLDEDLLGKWGALVYHSCFYNNKTTMAIGPGNSDCDKLYSPEYLYVPESPTNADTCSISTGQNPMIKVYSSMSQFYNFGYYCFSGGGLPLLYENGSSVGVSNIMSAGETADKKYYVVIALYPSDNPDRKGFYYDSIFYKGFFEGKIPGFTQVYPNIVVAGPKIPVRIFKPDNA